MSNHPQKIVELYRAFYRANNISARKSIQPLFEANNLICTCDPCIRENPEMLRDAIAGRLSKLMQQIRSNTAAGRFVISNVSEERRAILDFASYLANDIFHGLFNGDLGRFAGKQRGYIEDTCEYLYKLAEDEESSNK